MRICCIAWYLLHCLHSPCLLAGVQILVQGGNAVDSAITTALCQGIMSPAASGLGGGHFMIIRLPNGTTEVIDARETAPAAATEDMFRGTIMTHWCQAYRPWEREQCM